MNEQRIAGVVGELIFAQRAAEMGFVTSFPMFLASEYDVIIDTGLQLFRVQIKSTRSELRPGVFKFTIDSSLNVKYTGNCVDVFAFVHIDSRRIWLVPAHNVIHLKTFSVNENNGRNEMYLDFWEIFL
jgi:hypothetical protein